VSATSPASDPLDAARRRGRRAGILVFGVIVASVTAWWSIQILQQVFAPTVPALDRPCRQAMGELLQGLQQARQAAAAEMGGEKAGLRAFRQALGPSWQRRPALDQACAQDQGALEALHEIDELRYAEEHAVRYEAVKLARQRKRARVIAEQLGAPLDSPQ
jgi:hypothetical protein